MSKRVVLITGGSQGIGSACADTFLKKQFRVSICDLVARSEAPDLLVTNGDIVDPGIREHVVSRTLKEFGRIDVLINNAGVGLYCMASDTPLGLAARMFEVNVMAPVGMVQSVLPAMRAQGSGAIVNIGSIGGKVSLPWSTMYCASKYALDAVSEGLYRELKRDNIHVMTVIPGIVDTNFRFNVLAGTPPPDLETMKKLAPRSVADEIVRGLEKRRRTVWIPSLGYPFDLINRFLPQLIDYYLASKWRSWNESPKKGSASECG